MGHVVVECKRHKTAEGRHKHSNKMLRERFRNLVCAVHISSPLEYHLPLMGCGVMKSWTSFSNSGCGIACSTPKGRSSRTALPGTVGNFYLNSAHLTPIAPPTSTNTARSGVRPEVSGAQQSKAETYSSLRAYIYRCSCSNAVGWVNIQS